MLTLCANLPWPPSVNNYYSRSKYGVYLKPKVHIFRKKVWEALINHKRFNNLKVELHIKLFPPTQRKYDIDNSLKALLDALQFSKIIDDDSQILRLFVEKLEVVKIGKVEILLTEIN